MLFRAVILNVVHLRFLVVHKEFHKSLIKHSLTYVQFRLVVHEVSA